MLQCIPRRNPLIRIQIQTLTQQFVTFHRDILGKAGIQVHAQLPPGQVLFWDTRDIAVPFAAVQSGSCRHFFIAKNIRNFYNRIKVVGTLEERVSFR